MGRGVFALAAFPAARTSGGIAKGLAWKAVAEQSGISASTQARIAKGRRPDVDGLAAIAPALPGGLSAFDPGI